MCSSDLIQSNTPHTVSDEYVLCWNDRISLTQIGVVEPAAASSVYCDLLFPYNSSTLCDAGISYDIYNAIPTIVGGGDPAATNWGFVDIAPYGRVFTNNGLIESLEADGIVITDNTFWLVPQTFDSFQDRYLANGNLGQDGVRDVYYTDYNIDFCIDQAIPIKITMLNELVAEPTNSCDGLAVKVSGGHSEFFPSKYTINVTQPASGVTLTNTPVGHGETFNLEGLSDGDSYSIDITDANGCVINLSGVYRYTEPTIAINGLNSPYCSNDPVETLIGSPSPSIVTSGTYTISITPDGSLNEFSWEIIDNSGNIVDVGGHLTGTAYALNDEVVTTTPNLNAADGPFIVSLTDLDNDGLEGVTVTGSIMVINNLTGGVVGYVEGDFGSTFSFGIGNFYNSSGSFSGQGITDNGDGSATFDPNIVGTYNLTYEFDNGEGCTYQAVASVTVNEIPTVIDQIISICEDPAGSGEGKIGRAHV